jgi:DNA-binding NarL/FixJ family response regulator
MFNATNNILLISSGAEGNQELKALLHDCGYKVREQFNADNVHETLERNEIDLVISNYQVAGENVFSIYQSLKLVLIRQGIPFLLAVEEHEREDMVIALELGVDNVIFFPLQVSAVLRMIENEVSKKRRLQIMRTLDFREFFNLSNVPLIYVENHKIKAVNNALRSMSPTCFATIMHQCIEEAFDIASDKMNDLNYRRFKSEVTTFCKLSEVACGSHPEHTFNMFFYRGNSSSSAPFFVELLPSYLFQNPFKTLQQPAEQAIPNGNASGFKLTERELQVFQLSASGLPIKIIAEELQLSKRTVEKHRANIMEKVGARNMIEAIAALQNMIEIS